MKSNNNKSNNNNDGGDKHQQLRGSVKNRKPNKLANDEDKPAATGEDQNCRSNKNLEEGNDLDLEVESLSRKELIKLVRKQMATTMEAQKKFEMAKKEAEESAKQAEELSKRNIQLEQEKAAVQEDLRQKMAEIVKMHKEMEEKSEEIAENAKQIDALLVQLNEATSHQHQMPTEQHMKIQLSLETWFDWLAFVPRRRLGQIVPKVGDRKFASIIQKFLHEYGEITIADIEIVAPYEEDPSGYPRVRVWQQKYRRPLRFEMAETPLPANIRNFTKFQLSYFDQSVLNFIQKLQQNSLFDTVKSFGELSAKKIVQPVLFRLLPLFNGIVSVEVDNSAQLVKICDAGNSNKTHELNMKMMEETRFLGVSYDRKNLHANRIDLYCRWLYQTARADCKPRVLFLGRMHVDSTPISLFIDRIKKDFLMATHPVTFFVAILLPKEFQPQEGICLDNGKPKERLMTKMAEVKVQEDWVFLLISRYPLASTTKWIEENEKEVLAWDFADTDRAIYLTKELKVVAI